ncbi:MAG TPA: ABC transporter permease [Gemmatimonadales bacterium]|jgi:predicted permease|nr:ABC transporter permease [Gemmatimonadales bacterium]
MTNHFEIRPSPRAPLGWFGDALHDARIAVRSLGRQLGFTTAVLATLALGIGATVAIFSLVHAVLLRPLPYREPARLVHLWETHAGEVSSRSEASYPDFLDWRAATDLFAGVEGYNGTNVTLSGPDGATRVRGLRVTAGFTGMLGVTPVLGRAFQQEDDLPGGTRSVMLSYGFWERRFGASRSILNQAVDIDGEPYTVVGVLPRGFRFGDVDLWFPLGGGAGQRAERFNHWVNTVARLRDGVTIEQARSRMADLMRALAAQYPETNSGRGVILIPLKEQLTGAVRTPLLVLLGAVTLVLLIACANVAGLVVARAIERGREIAVRAAIGASRGRLVRQLLTESTVLALAGGILGAWLAALGVRLLVAAAPDSLFDQMPALRDAQVDGTALAVALGVAALSGILVGLAPTWFLTRGSAGDLLRGGDRAGTGSARQRFRDSLVTVEIALTLVLVVGASLLERSLVRLLRVDPGFTAEHVVTARVALAGPPYADGAPQQRFFEAAIARLASVPGVDDVGAVSNPPLQGGGTNTFRVEGAPEPPASRRPEAVMRGVAGDYFRTLGIPLVAGRGFTARDDSTSAPVLMINRSLARGLFAGGSAVGRRLRFYAFPESAWTIVGVVGDVKTARLDAAPPPTVYLSHLQAAENRMNLVVRGNADPGVLLAAIRRVVGGLDPSIPVYGAVTMEEQIVRSGAVAARRYPLVLISVAALAALVLAIVGVYGLIAFAVARRTRELAIRMALGAQDRSVVVLVVRRGVLLAAAGIALGVPGALALTRFLGGLLYGVSPADLTVYTGVSLGLLLVTTVASYLPARRATLIDPGITLRAE